MPELTIKERVERINTMRSRLTQELLVIQAECTHPNKTGRYGGNTGNYDPSADCYWITCHCPDCNTGWTIYDDEAGYKQFDGRIIRD